MTGGVRLVMTLCGLISVGMTIPIKKHEILRLKQVRNSKLKVSDFQAGYNDFVNHLEGAMDTHGHLRMEDLANIVHQEHELTDGDMHSAIQSVELEDKAKYREILDYLEKGYAFAKHHDDGHDPELSRQLDEIGRALPALRAAHSHNYGPHGDEDVEDQGDRVFDSVHPHVPSGLNPDQEQHEADHGNVPENEWEGVPSSNNNAAKLMRADAQPAVAQGLAQDDLIGAQYPTDSVGDEEATYAGEEAPGSTPPGHHHHVVPEEEQTLQDFVHDYDGYGDEDLDSGTRRWTPADDHPHYHQGHSHPSQQQHPVQIIVAHYVPQHFPPQHIHSTQSKKFGNPDSAVKDIQKAVTKGMKEILNAVKKDSKEVSRESAKAAIKPIVKKHLKEIHEQAAVAQEKLEKAHKALYEAEKKVKEKNEEYTEAMTRSGKELAEQDHDTSLNGEGEEKAVKHAKTLSDEAKQLAKEAMGEEEEQQQEKSKKEKEGGSSGGSGSGSGGSGSGSSAGGSASGGSASGGSASGSGGGSAGGSGSSGGR